MERGRAAARRPTRGTRNRKRRHRVENGRGAIFIDCDEDEVQVLNVRGVGKAPKFITLVDSSDEENRENRSPKPHRKRAKSSTSEAEAADRALAERLHREEERLATKRLNRELTRAGEMAGGPTGMLAAPSRRHDAEKCLKREQDKEYEETLLLDQIKDVERRDAEERERCVSEEREEEEQFEAARRASELETARARTKGGEPPANSNGAVTRLRLSLPSGKKVDRRFLSSDTLSAVRAFLLIYFRDRDVEIGNIGLVTNFPKREFGELDDGMSLEEAGLAPQAMVMVRDLDA